MMKKLLLIGFVLLICQYSIKAQDIITKTSGEEIKARVLEIGPVNILYKEYENPHGSDFQIDKRKVYMIVYEDGSKEIISPNSAPKQNTSPQNNTVHETNTSQKEEPTVSETNQPEQHSNQNTTPTNVQKTETSDQKPQSNFYKNRQHIYFALAPGLGNSYGGIGLRAQGRFGGTVGFGIHGGIGYTPPGNAETGMVLGAFGMKFFPYKWIYINTQIGAFGFVDTETEYWSDYTETDRRVLWGPSVLFGGDFIFGKHFGFNVAYGFSVDVNPGEPSELYRAIDLGFIFKF